MRIFISTFLIIITLTRCSAQNKKSILLQNTLDIEREDELVIVSKGIIEKLRPEGKKKLIPIVTTEDQIPVPSQLEDIDDDGIWDQLLLTTNFKPKQQKKILLHFVTETPDYPKVTDIHFGIGSSAKDISEVQSYTRTGDPRNSNPKKFFQMEGPAWENDKVGFRMYFDPRNGIDIFGKTTTDLVLSRVGIEGDYHTKQDWGMDILKVGTSLGAGSIAIKLKDTLYRITGKNGATFRSIEEGPIKASFEILYTNDTITGIPIQTKHKISIYKGQWYYKSDVFLSGITKEMELTAGIVNLKPNILRKKSIQNHHILYSFGKQSEYGDHLGMALFFNKNLYKNHTTISRADSDITNTHYTSLKTVNDQHISFYFLAGWESSDTIFQSEKGFQKVLENTVRRLSYPILITYEKSN